MKWQCALLQRWLPEYPDGDLPALGKWWLRSHVPHCAACRREVAELREVVTALEATPAPDPGPEFWREFSREMHLKLAQAAHAGQASPEPARSWWLRLPYLLGAPALAVLLVWVAVQFTGPVIPVKNQAMVKQEAAPKVAPAAKMAIAPKPAAPPQGAVAELAVVEPFVPVALEEAEAVPVEEEEITGWGLDAELAGMSDHEKEVFLNKLDQHKKDGSCIERFSFYSWG
jgi:hypothetical protein